MKTALTTLALLAAAGWLGGCVQTSLLRPISGNDDAWATVEDPIFPGTARITVVLNRKTYSGIEAESDKVATDEQPLRFGWDPAHKHPNIKQEGKFFFGSTTLVASDGSKLPCDYLHHGDDWRLRCKTAGGGEVALQRVAR